MKRAAIVLLCIAALGVSLPIVPSASAQLPEIELELVAGNLSSPVYVTHAGDGTNRLFIVEQTGAIKVLQPGASTPTVFLNIANRIVSGGERGLLGLAFHPDYANNRRFFVNYTRAGDGATVIAEYRASAGDPNVADTNETILLVIPQPFANHNGGTIQFGPDGFLYIGMGDGGSANDPGNRAQNINELLGKMLRIDVDRQSSGNPYAVPPDNPFVGQAGRDEIYAIGLRNPFRFSFDRQTGDLWAGDVGQNQIEEIDIVTRGGNYGWRVFEGTRCTGLGPAPCTASNFTPPVAEYSHLGGRCSVTGGYVYRGTAGTLPVGMYVFGDFCSGEIMALQGARVVVLRDTNFNISSFGEDEAGELYVVNLNGSVHRIVGPDVKEPPPQQPPEILAIEIRHRRRGTLLDPVIVRPNGKKFEVIVSAQFLRPGLRVAANGRELNTREGEQEGQLIGRLRRNMLSAPGQLVIDLRGPDGVRSNPIIIPIVAAP